MLKNVRKSQILLSIVVIALVFVLLGNIHSLATEGGASNPVTITATTQNTSTTDNTSNTANVSGTSNISSIVSASGNSANQTANNTSTYNNTTTSSSGLPYTGTNSKVILLVVAFGISAIYAYKKVSDYNV